MTVASHHAGLHAGLLLDSDVAWEVVTSLAVCRIVGQLLVHQRLRPGCYTLAAAACLAASACRCIWLWVDTATRQRAALPSSLPLRLLLLLLAHVGVCFLDCRWNASLHKSSLTPRTFGRALSRATCYVLPVYPLLSIVISLLCLLVYALLHAAFGLQLDRVRQLMGICALHTPFCWIHTFTRKILLSDGLYSSVKTSEDATLPHAPDARPHFLGRVTRLLLPSPHDEAGAMPSVMNQISLTTKQRRLAAEAASARVARERAPRRPRESV